MDLRVECALRVLLCHGRSENPQHVPSVGLHVGCIYKSSQYLVSQKGQRMGAVERLNVQLVTVIVNDGNCVGLSYLMVY